MKLLLINPNISESVSELIRAEAERCASPGTVIEVLTAPFGVAYCAATLIVSGGTTTMMAGGEESKAA